MDLRSVEQLLLWEAGSTKTLQGLLSVGQTSKPPIFKTVIEDNSADAYTFHNLKAATAYKVQMIIKYVDIRAYEKQKEIKKAGAGSGLPPEEKKPIYKYIESHEVFFNTAQKPIDIYISEELNQARESRREKSRLLPFVKSERLLEEFYHEKTPGIFPERPTDNYEETLHGSLLAARQHKNWLSYLHSGYSKHSQPAHLKLQRTNRMLLITHAIDAFEEVPREPKGQRVMEGDWHMGPFYQWDKNFLEKNGDTV